MDYSKITNEDFNRLLKELVNKEPASNLLLIPGVYEIVSEEYNNEVLNLWASENSDI